VLYLILHKPLQFVPKTEYYLTSYKQYVK